MMPSRAFQSRLPGADPRRGRRLPRFTSVAVDLEDPCLGGLAQAIRAEQCERVTAVSLEAHTDQRRGVALTLLECRLAPLDGGRIEIRLLSVDGVPPVSAEPAVADLFAPIDAEPPFIASTYESEENDRQRHDPVVVEQRIGVGARRDTQRELC